jgi:hypothetical protein
MESIINDMENLNIGQQATLQLMQDNVAMTQNLQTEDQHRWDQWWGWQPPQ